MAPAADLLAFPDLGAVFFALAGAFCLLTRPDFVFLRTVGVSVTAGACISVSHCKTITIVASYWSLSLSGLGRGPSFGGSVGFGLSRRGLLCRSCLLRLSGNSLWFGSSFSLGGLRFRLLGGLLLLSSLA